MATTGEGAGRAGAAPTAPNRIFMSYRRQETEWPAGWLFDRLTEHFHGAEVFKDIDSIEPGDDFVEVITTAVESCDVLLALIGDKWLTMTDDEGRRRIDNPDDFVRLEIEAALSRGVRVIPILTYEARMPRAQDLPASLAGLVRRQALQLSVTRFDDDVTRLLRVLDKTLAEARTRPTSVPTPPMETAQTQTPTQISPHKTRTPPQQLTPSEQTPSEQTPSAQTPPEHTPPEHTPSETPRGLLAAGARRRSTVLAVAAVAIALVVVATAVWLWPRVNTDTARKANTSATTPTASGPTVSDRGSPTTTAELPLLTWQGMGSPAAKLGGPAAAAYQGHIWVVGGMGRAVRIYNPTSRQWQDGPSLPADLSYGALASDGQRLYYMGGIKDNVWGVSDVYVLDSPDGSWKAGPALPDARFSGAAAWDGSRIVFAGGSQGRRPRRAASAIWALTSRGWNVVGNLPSPREHLAATSDGKGTVWFVGGADVSTNTVSGEVDEVRGSTVGQSGALQTPVEGLAAVWSSASGVCAIGGSPTLPNGTLKPTATVTCLGGRTWPGFPQATSLATSATLGDTAYVVAGNTMFALRFAS